MCTGGRCAQGGRCACKDRFRCRDRCRQMGKCTLKQHCGNFVNKCMGYKYKKIRDEFNYIF